MTWGLFVLILVFVIAFIVLCYLNVDGFGYFMENYFIFILLIVFIILLFVIDFNNQIQITTYVKVKNAFTTPLLYEVPTQDDTNITNIINVAFTGLYGDSGDVANLSATNTTIDINYDTIAVDTPVPLWANNIENGDKLFVIRKLASGNLEINTPTGVDFHSVDGYLTLTLLCTGSQTINNSFKRVD
jgi:hypothetical protein